MQSEKIASDIQIPSPQKLVAQVRELIYAQPIGASSYSNFTGDIKINLVNGVTDLRNSWLQFNAVMANSGAGSAGFTWPISTIFARVRLFAWNKLIVDMQDYPVIAGAFAGARDVDAASTMDRDGSSVGATRLTQSQSVQTYMIRFENDFFKRVYPSYALGGGNLQIVLNMSLPQTHAEVTGGAALANLTTTISDIYYYYHAIQMSPPIQQFYDAQIASGWKLYCDNWTTTNSSQVSGNIQNTQLPFKNTCVKAILMYCMPTADITSGIQVTPGSKWVCDAPITNYSSILLRGGNQTWPQTQQDLSSPASYKMFQMEFQSVMNKWTNQHYRSGSAFITQSTIQANAFWVMIDLRMDSSPSSDGLLQNGVNFAGAIQPIFTQKFTAGPGNQTAFFLCLHESCLTVGPASASYDA